MTYKELKDKHYNAPLVGLKFAFGNEQFENMLKDFEKDGIHKDDIFHFGAGCFGTNKAWEDFNNRFSVQQDEIKSTCKPDEVFAYEWANHECGYTGNISEALDITREYFPEYMPTQELLNRLRSEYNECN